MHTKRMVSPGFWKAGRKVHKFIVTPSPGGHPKRQCIPLGVLLRDVLGLATSEREARALMNTGVVTVDNKIRKSHAFPVGLMDSVTVGQTSYRLVPYSGGLKPIETTADDAKLKVLKVKGKTTLRGGKTQLSMHDGRVLVSDNSKGCAVGDSVLFDSEKGEIKATIPLDKGSLALVFGGLNRGKSARIIQIRRNKNGKDTIILEDKDKHFETLKDYVIAIGKEAPLVKVI